jgi:hypothetical protein
VDVIIIPTIDPQSSLSIIWGWYNRPIGAAEPGGLSLTTLEVTLHVISYIPHFMHSSYVGQTDIFSNTFPLNYLRFIFCVTHPYKTTGKIAVSTFSGFKNRWDGNSLETE